MCQPSVCDGAAIYGLLDEPLPQETQLNCPSRINGVEGRDGLAMEKSTGSVAKKIGDINQRSIVEYNTLEFALNGIKK